MSNPDNEKQPGIRARAPVPLDRCGMAKASEILGDRWSLLILREAFYGVMRFADMQADLGVPRSILTGRLGKLVEAGLLTRFEYQEGGARKRHAYRLTERGRDLALVLLAMKQWWDDGADREPSVEFIAKGTTRPAKVILTDDNGKEIGIQDLTLKQDAP